LDFLQNKPDQVSGSRPNVDDPYARFVEKMKQLHPDHLNNAFQDMEKQKEGKKRKWDELVHGKVDGSENDTTNDDAGGFSFGFRDDGSDIEVP
jgi:hypothetical protein